MIHNGHGFSTRSTFATLSSNGRLFFGKYFLPIYTSLCYASGKANGSASQIGAILLTNNNIAGVQRPCVAEQSITLQSWLSVDAS